MKNLISAIILASAIAIPKIEPWDHTLRAEHFLIVDEHGAIIAELRPEAFRQNMTIQPANTRPTAAVSTATPFFATASGKKYHTDTCRYGQGTGEPITIQDIRARALQACKICRPPAIKAIRGIQ